MIPVRRRTWVDSMVPENWGRTRDSYQRAAGESSKRRVQPQSKTAKDQLKRFEARRKEDERKMKGIML